MRISLLLNLLFILFVFILASASADSGEAQRKISFRQIVEKAMDINPRLKTAYYLYEAAKEQFKGSGLQPNPGITLSYAYWDAPEDSNILNQTFEVFGRAKYRKKAAESLMRAEEARYIAMCQNLTSEVGSAYFNTLMASHIRSVEEENLEMAESFLEAAKNRYRVGDIPLLQVMQARIEYKKAINDLELSKLNEKNAYNHLFKSVGLSESGNFELLDYPFNLEINIPPLKELKDSATSKRPEIVQAKWEKEEQAAIKSVIQSQNHPDIILSAYRAKLYNDAAQGIRLAFSMPLIDWGSIKAEMLAAMKREKAKEMNVDDIINNVIWETEEYYNEVGNLKKRLSTLNNDLISEQEKITLMINRGYRAGLNNYLEVLESRRTLRELKKQYYEMLAEYQKALLNLERASCMEIFDKEASKGEKV